MPADFTDIEIAVGELPEPEDEMLAEPVKEVVPEPVKEVVPEPVKEVVSEPVEEDLPEAVEEDLPEAGHVVAPAPESEPAHAPEVEPAPVAATAPSAEPAPAPAPEPEPAPAKKSRKKAEPKADAPAKPYAWMLDVPPVRVKNIRSAISLQDRALFIKALFKEDFALYDSTIGALHKREFPGLESQVRHCVRIHDGGTQETRIAGGRNTLYRSHTGGKPFGYDLSRRGSPAQRGPYPCRRYPHILGAPAPLRDKRQTSVTPQIQ